MEFARTSLAFLSSGAADADEAARRLADTYGHTDVAQADVIVALGGDGFMLQTLRDTMGTGKPVYGMNRGTVGFLMNEFRERRPARAHRRRAMPRRSGRSKW